MYIEVKEIPIPLKEFFRLAEIFSIQLRVVLRDRSEFRVCWPGKDAKVSSPDHIICEDDSGVKSKAAGPRISTSGPLSRRGVLIRFDINEITAICVDVDSYDQIRFFSTEKTPLEGLH
jgi:hypothetical protein